ncbi:MAG TPA: M48 family metalloprotease [Jatrophihabitantaceae bacterium]|nr:M48 family metalloprotease [Jatrophihabitantaceae bacterium]
MTRIGSGPQWCMACEWNLGAFEPPHGVAATRARRRDHRLAFAINRRLFAELGAQRPERPGWTTARVGLLATSIALLVFDLGLVGFGVYLVVTGWSLVKVVGVFLLLLGIELRPRLPRLPKGAEMLSRSGHSRLYALVDAVGERIGAPPIDGVVVNETYNASCNRYGLRRRRILTIGMPLWAALGPDARIALLGHELGHLINADPGMSLLTQPALTTFGRLARIFHPHGMIRAGAYRTGADTSPLARAAAYLIFAPLSWAAARMHVRLWKFAMRDHQRAELYADAVSVRVGGTAGAVEVMTCVLLAESVNSAMHRASRVDGSPAHLRQAARTALAIDRALVLRREQHSLRIESSFLSTHPPTGLRLRVLRAWPEQRSSVAVAAAEFDAADAELSAEYRHLVRVIAQ